MIITKITADDRNAGRSPALHEWIDQVRMRGHTPFASETVQRNGAIIKSIRFIDSREVPLSDQHFAKAHKKELFEKLHADGWWCSWGADGQDYGSSMDAWFKSRSAPAGKNHPLLNRQIFSALVGDGTMVPIFRKGGHVYVERNATVEVDDCVAIVLTSGDKLVRQLVAAAEHSITVRQFRPYKDYAIQRNDIKQMFRIPHYSEFIDEPLPVTTVVGWTQQDATAVKN